MKIPFLTKKTRPSPPIAPESLPVQSTPQPITSPLVNVGPKTSPYPFEQNLQKESQFQSRLDGTEYSRSTVIPVVPPRIRIPPDQPLQRNGILRQSNCDIPRLTTAHNLRLIIEERRLLRNGRSGPDARSISISLTSLTVERNSKSIARDGEERSGVFWIPRDGESEVGGGGDGAVAVGTSRMKEVFRERKRFRRNLFQSIRERPSASRHVHPITPTRRRRRRRHPRRRARSTSSITRRRSAEDDSPRLLRSEDPRAGGSSFDVEGAEED